MLILNQVFYLFDITIYSVSGNTKFKNPNVGKEIPRRLMNNVLLTEILYWFRFQYLKKNNKRHYIFRWMKICAKTRQISSRLFDECIINSHYSIKYSERNEFKIAFHERY